LRDSCDLAIPLLSEALLSKLPSTFLKVKISFLLLPFLQRRINAYNILFLPPNKRSVCRTRLKEEISAIQKGTLCVLRRKNLGSSIGALSVGLFALAFIFIFDGG